MNDISLLTENTAGTDLFKVQGDGNVSVGATQVSDTRFVLALVLIALQDLKMAQME